ncbi:HAMP domain-containing sensor histidine kinase [Streptomyces sp. GESEQ-4]|uniref:sensor histidine kinase n=1 Tax=Streptomyces sp. GESEQ-4 TaxID=2812655 RepID=UPI001FF08CCB|nr:HAMP domain-containing sensor histidine kinase [Streptomyces sp. GESEQ-4]
MTRPFASLLWKITALVGTACCVVALVIGVLVHGATYDRSIAEGEAKALTQLADASQQKAGAADAVIRSPRELPRTLREQVRKADGRPQTWYDTRVAHVPSMWAAQESEGRWTGVRVHMDLDWLSRKALDRHMAYAAIAALALVLPLSALATELLVRRLRRVAATARRITEGELDARTGGPGRSRDEIADISVAVDHMAGSLERRLRSEQRFTADVAHELRTPLMGLVTSAELLPESEATDLVRDRVRVLRTLVEELLEVSKLDAGAEQAEPVTVPLGELVEDSVRRTGLTVRVSAASAGTVRTDPRRLDRILANLVGNAHRHGRAPVTVAVDGATVVVRDHGPGFPAELLAHGPQRFRTGAVERGQGHGLGLTIALGQAQVIQARLEFANAPDGGATATLRLPPG